MAKPPLLSGIGSLLTAWFGGAIAATVALLIAFAIVSDMARDPLSLLPVALLCFMITSVGALPVLLLLVLTILMARRFLPPLSARPLGMTLLLALVGGLASMAIVYVFVTMFVDTAALDLKEGVMSVPLLAGAVGGVTLGALISRPKLREM